MAEGFIAADIIGLRDLIGRFASLRDGGLMAIQLAAAQEAAKELQEMYRADAPAGHSTRWWELPEHTGPFAQSIHGRAQASGVGFLVEVETSQPTVRSLIAGGHGPVFPHRTWLRAFAEGVYLRHAAGVAGNPWEDAAGAGALMVAEETGNRIGQQVIAVLSG